MLFTEDLKKNKKNKNKIKMYFYVLKIFSNVCAETHVFVLG